MKSFEEFNATEWEVLVEQANKHRWATAKKSHYY